MNKEEAKNIVQMHLNALKDKLTQSEKGVAELADTVQELKSMANELKEQLKKQLLNGVVTS
jgi:uncharacterized phage infection (PIP) family protein YhgE